MRSFILLFILAFAVSGCTTTKLQLSGDPGIVMLTEIDKKGKITDQRVLVPSEVESTNIKEYQIRRPEKLGTVQLRILEKGKTVLQRTIPPGVQGGVAKKEEAWEFHLLRGPRANPPPQAPIRQPIR